MKSKLQIASPLGRNKVLLKHSYQHLNWMHILIRSRMPQLYIFRTVIYLIYEVLYLSLWFYTLFGNKLNILNSTLVFFHKQKYQNYILYSIVLGTIWYLSHFKQMICCCLQGSERQSWYLFYSLSRANCCTACAIYWAICIYQNLWIFPKRGGASSNRDGWFI